MLGITNIITAIALLLTTYVLGQSWINGHSSGYLLLIGSLISLIACAALTIETLLGDDVVVVQRLRRRARPIQYLILLWVWILWFGNRADWYDLLWSSIIVDFAQTAMTLFVLLEMAHRVQLGRLHMQMVDCNPITLMKEALHSLRVFLSESEIAAMRATSADVMQSLRALTDLVTACFLAMLLLGWGDLSQNTMITYEITLRLFAIYVLQIFARFFISYQSQD
jgi:hypothetical protein